MIEREVKLSFPDAGAARSALLGAGAAAARARRLQDDSLYDTADETFRKKGCMVRLRTERWPDGAHVTFITIKGPVQPGPMKMREEHLVPLAPQAVEILRELEPLTGRGRYLFPSLRSPREPMSENTVNAALRRLGYDKDTMTGHGFRAMASTRLNEMGWKEDVIERQLAHAERNKVRAAYNRAQYLAERKKMMAAWADYLDELRASTGKVLAFKRA